jgi:hypothetical protein
MSMNRTMTVLAVSALLVTMTGCAGGGGDGGSGTPVAEDGGPSTTECLSGKTWVLDIDDLAGQLAAQLRSGGLNVIETIAEGRQTFEFTETGEASSSVDVTYTMTVDSGEGIVITIVQTHGGEPSGEWAWLGDTETVTFSNWDNAGYSVQNTVLVNGVGSDAPIEVPSDTLGGTDMLTDCSGTTLSTQVEASPFTQHWNAEG